MGRNASDILARHGITLSADELAHYGKKGMRWGKRKATSSSEDDGPPKPDVKKMSDDDLKAAINRIKLEKEYVKLTQPEVSSGQKIVKSLLSDVGTVARKQGRNYLDRQIEELMKEGIKGAAKKTAKVGAQLALEAAVSKATPASARPVVQFAKRPGF